MKHLKKLQNLSFQTSLFLILSIVITLVCGLVFMTGVQIYRESANDPQIQVSGDMARYLSEGNNVNAIMPQMQVDISKSLVWFAMVFNDNGEVVATNAKLDGQTPELPFGVLDHARKNGQNRVIWEPKAGVRIASVVTSYNGGSVLIGRSLRETENRIRDLGEKIFMVWVLTLAMTFAGTLFLLPNSKKSQY